MSYQIEYRHLKYFLAVAEHLHFGKAAEQLYIAQPGLSRQIKQLEEQLGILLFERNNRNVSLTEAGLFLKEELGIQLNNISNILGHAQLIHAGLEGTLKLAYVGSAMQNIIPELLLKLRSTHPNIHFNLKEMDNRIQIEELIALHVDLGFVRLERVPRELELRPVFEDTFSLVLPKNHPLTAQDFHSLEQLKDEAFIMFERSYSPTYYEKMRQIFDSSGFTPIVAHHTVHASTIYKLVENNFGISIVPTSLKHGYQMDIKFIELTNIPQRTVLSMVWNTKNRNPLLQKVLELF
jgi:DNA-binding transcriptional LysR family regulator